MGKGFNTSLLTFPVVEMEKRDEKLVEYSLEALLIAWLGYLFLYQNYLLYKWHRGLPLPSKLPFILGGVVMGVTFLAYELWKLGKNTENRGNREVSGD
jgi:H+/Cl- antiporter ClcA